MNRTIHAARRQPTARRAFSLVEVLVALTITATLLVATLSALDASFKSYKTTTEGASTHVVSRIVMHRILTMIRTGSEFGPYPVNPILEPRIESTSLEFLSFEDVETGVRQITRIERRNATEGSESPYELWYVLETYDDGALIEERPLITTLYSVNFTLDYDVGPRLTRATIDMTIRPDDDQADRIHAGMDAPAIRMVSSVTPRRLDE